MSTIKFPFEVIGGKIQLVDKNTDGIRQGVQDRIATPKGSVFFKNEYGSKLGEVMYIENNEVSNTLIRHYVIEALNQEDRIDVGDINLTKINANQI